MTDNATMIVVTDHGFARDDLPAEFDAGRYGEVTLDTIETIGNAAPAQIGLSLPVNSRIVDVQPFLPQISVIKIPFDGFNDGRGFSLAMQLRRSGYAGRLRATGHILPDQYAHARRCGFCEVAITADQARRQPEEQWQAQVARIDATYQRHLQQAAPAA